MPAFALTTTMPATSFVSYPDLRGKAPGFLPVDPPALLIPVSASR
jgi:hypothetical protein